MRRVSKTVDGVTTYFIWGGDELLTELDGSGVLQRRYVYGTGFTPVVMGTPDGVGGEDFYESHTNHLDTPRALTDQAGNIVWSANYAPFGMADVDPNASVTFPFRFPGQYEDPESGLHYNRFRYYDPLDSRYISADPIGQVGGVNQYLYARNAPLSYIDPTGQFTGVEEAAATIILAGVLTYALIKCAIEGCARPLQEALESTADTAAEMCEALMEGAGDDGSTEEGAPSDGLIGENARDAGSRTNTDLPGGREAAEGVFGELTEGQPTTKHPMPDGGEREIARDGTQIRRNADGSTRVDVPGRGPRGRETIHFD